MAKIEQNLGLGQNTGIDASLDFSASTLPRLETPVHNYIESLPGKLIKYRVAGDPDVAGYEATATPVKNPNGKPVGYNFTSNAGSVTEAGIEFEERDANTTRLRVNLSNVQKIAGGIETGSDRVSSDSRSNSLYLTRRPEYTSIARAEKAEYALSA